MTVTRKKTISALRQPIIENGASPRRRRRAQLLAALRGERRAPRRGELRVRAVTLRTIRFTSGTDRGATLSCRTPSPMSANAMSGCDAISPHTATSSRAASRPPPCAGSAASTAGWSGVKRVARFALPRSTASVYCTRSFVPMLKKRRRRANVSHATAAAGVSIITPSGTSLRNSAPRALGARAPPRRAARAPARTSSSVTMSGSMMRTSPWIAARSSARSCDAEHLGLVEAHADRAPSEERIRLAWEIRRPAACRRRCRRCE